MDTATKIIHAGLDVFSRQGYNGASTKDIAQAAGVSEMTLFRKFQTKQNLFETILRTTLGDAFDSGIQRDIATTEIEWVRRLLDHRLTIVARHIDLVRMVITESIHGRIPDELNHVLTMNHSIHSALAHIPGKNKGLADLLVAILLHYAILTPRLRYHELSPSERQVLLDDYLSPILL
jgi:AcrR family transcriptional regulator